MSSNQISGATIAIATFRRPDLLNACLASCLSQRDVPAPVEILVIDNCPDGSAQAKVREVSSRSPTPIRYVHEPRPGIACARNAALDHAGHDVVAFIDDDETAADDWLANLLKCRATTGADIVLGPVLPDPKDGRADAGVFGAVLAPDIPDAPTGAIVASKLTTPYWRRSGKAFPSMGAGNALIDLRSSILKTLRFEPMLGRTGGEDTLYFNQALLDGATIVWCADAQAFELLEGARMNIAYVRRKAFRSGQLVSWVPYLTRPRQLDMVAQSMIIATVQIPVFGMNAVVSRLCRPDRRVRDDGRFWGALGRLLWMGPFRFQSYGCDKP